MNACLQPDRLNLIYYSGQIGDWKNHFTDELNNRFDQWIEDKTKGTDLKFPAFSQ